MTSSSPNQFSSDWMRKLSKISIYKYALITEIMIANPLNNMQTHIMNNLEKFTCLLSAVIFICFIWMASDKRHHHLDQFFSQILTPVSKHQFLLVLLFIFSCIEFSILMLWCLSWSNSLSSFFNNPISIIFVPNFKHSWLRIPIIFYHSPQWISFLNEFYDSFYCFYW